MTHRLIGLVAVSSTVAACAGAAPALGYGVPSPSEVRYSYADTTTVGVSMMGQSMEMSQRGVAEYAVSFASAPSGVGVTMRLTTLSGTLTQPMGAPVRIDEGDVEGALVFSLDADGDVVVTERPVVAVEASQLVSGLALAHGFFPALPARAAAVGDRWVDTVSYEGTEGQGRRSETSVLRYTVVGDTTVAGRSLLRIGIEGTTEVAGEISASGMSVTQSSELDVQGWVLWDVEAGLMVEHLSTASGSGTASIPIAPNPIPIRIRAGKSIRLLGR